MAWIQFIRRCIPARTEYHANTAYHFEHIFNMSVLDAPLPAAGNAPEAAVLKAETVEAQALVITATINCISPTVAGVGLWTRPKMKSQVRLH
jgi:hypothetical protein